MPSVVFIGALDTNGWKSDGQLWSSNQVIAIICYSEGQGFERFRRVGSGTAISGGAQTYCLGRRWLGLAIRTDKPRRRFRRWSRGRTVAQSPPVELPPSMMSRNLSLITGLMVGQRLARWGTSCREPPGCRSRAFLRCRPCRAWRSERDGARERGDGLIPIFRMRNKSLRLSSFEVDPRTATRTVFGPGNSPE